MARKRSNRVVTDELPETFLPVRVAKAADAAMQEVLDEDRLLHKYGVQPPHGRSR